METAGPLYFIAPIATLAFLVVFPFFPETPFHLFFALAFIPMSRPTLKWIYGEYSGLNIEAQSELRLQTKMRKTEQEIFHHNDKVSISPLSDVVKYFVFVPAKLIVFIIPH